MTESAIHSKILLAVSSQLSAGDGKDGMRRFVLLAAVLAVSTLGCSQGADQVLSTPTIVPPTKVETFSGTLAPRTISTTASTSTHPFTVSLTSEVEITLTSIGPPADVQVGLGIGLPSGVGCVLTLGAGTYATVQASSTPQIKGTAVPGNLCVTVYDVGNLTQTVSYVVTVAHS
jgi:hypothetical protein